MKRIVAYGPSLVVLATTIAVLAAGPAAVRRITYAHTEAVVMQTRQRMDANPVLEQINQAYRDIAKVVEPSVVHISTQHTFQDQLGRIERRTSSGSGWIYDADGHIVTNHHVVENSEQLDVQLYDGTIHEAVIVGEDPLTDIAVIKIAEDRVLPAARRPRDEPVSQGDMVFAFGSPFEFRFSMSSGVVSGQGRSVGVIRDELGQRNGYENFIQVDAAINPGNSGGPLTDHRGRVIGMNTAIATGRQIPGDFERGQFAGIGLAIPMEMIEPVVTQLIETGVVSKGYLGLHVRNLQTPLRSALETIGYSQYGVFVARVDPRHPAAEAGLRIGDIITAIDDTELSTVNQLRSVVNTERLPERVTLSVVRFDDETAGLRTDEILVDSPTLRGLHGLVLLQPRDATIAELADLLDFSGRGVMVTRLEPGHPAVVGGIRRLDIITHINRTAIKSVQQLRSVVSSMMPGEVATVSVWRVDPETGAGGNRDFGIALAELDTIVSTGRLPVDQSLNECPRVGVARWAPSTRRLAEQMGVDYHEGVMVLELIPGSRLEELTPPGSIIIEVGGRPISTVRQMYAEFDNHDLRAPFGARLTVIRPDGRRDSDVRLFVARP